MDHREVAVIVGVGPGLGHSLSRRFSRAEMQVAMAARNPSKLDSMAVDSSGITHQARAYACDASDEQQVEELFRQICADLGEPDLVVYNAGAYAPGGIAETTAAAFERSWRVGCFGGFLVGRAAARIMTARVARGGHGGTILFTGATASLRGSAGFVSLAVSKFGLRALAQSMARELQPKGVHVAHVVIDGRIRAHAVEPDATDKTDSQINPDAIAETYFQLHRQPRSAWSLEVDLRPWAEKF
jgi:NAD(P)-dependent dehydrogenase (short-subunit alcohol dehydrogenase family)